MSPSRTWFKLSPIARAQWARFISIKRGYYSLVALAVMVVLALGGELLVNSRALVVHYQGKYYFPTYGAIIPGTTFGLDYNYETNYRDLQKTFQANRSSGNWLWMPPIPYNPFEMDMPAGVYPPTPPCLASQHYLGTDSTGRDIFTRLFYGFRVTMLGAIVYLIFTYLIGIMVGCSMGYWGGGFDLTMQRLIEIWSNLPFLYLVIIVTSLVRPNLWILLSIIILFSWTGMTYYMRTATYKEKARDYVAAAKVLGSGSFRILFKHILPNVLSTLITFMPFTLAAAITALTALDFLGFGLPPPTPSWGQLMREGTQTLSAPWIVASAAGALVWVLTLITFIGEAVREAFDPKEWSIYE